MEQRTLKVEDLVWANDWTGKFDHSSLLCMQGLEMDSDAPRTRLKTSAESDNRDASSELHKLGGSTLGGYCSPLS